MNQRERDALRNEHTKVTGFIGNKEIVPYCLGCGDYIDDDRQPYPCDVIKVLDAWEAETNPDIGASATSDTLPEYECDHLWLTKAGSDYRANPAEICAKCDTVRRYCPNCEEKL